MEPKIAKKEMLVERNTFKFDVVKEKARQIDVEIGDIKQDAFLPQIKIKQWSNEANFSMRLVDDDYNGKVSEKQGAIEWKKGIKTARMYPLKGFENGGLEFEVEFASKPDTNVVEFSIQSKELDFFYQEEVSDTHATKRAEHWGISLEEAKRRIRPENIVGSYAVYHKTKRNNFVGGKEYRTGKAFHIYRPHAEDANGKRVWCDLNIENDVLRVTIPQDFLDSAMYPIIVDPTFGHTTIGASSDIWGNGYPSAQKATLGSSGTIKGVFMAITTSAGGGITNGSLDVAIYEHTTDTNGGSLLASASGLSDLAVRQYSDPLGPNWYQTPVSYAATADDYFLGWITDGSDEIEMYYDSSTGEGFIDDGAFHSTFQDPFTEDYSSTTLLTSIYAIVDTATNIASQDTAITAPADTNVRVRALVNGLTGSASHQLQLEYQLNGGGYGKVPNTAVTPGTTGAIESGDVTESGNNTASGSWAISHPAASAGDLLIFCVGWDDSTNVTGLTAPSGANGETAVVIENVTASSSTSIRGKVVYYLCTGSWSAGTKTFTPSASEQWSAIVIKVPAGEFDGTTPIGGHNAKASTTTSNPSSPAVTAGSTDGGGKLVCFIVGDTDNPDSSPASNWSILTSTDRGAVGVGAYTRDSYVTDSESISSETGWTFPAGRDWVSFSFIVRPPADINNAVYLSDSLYISDNAYDKTIALMAAPSGKTTGNFVEGRLSDDTNPLPAITIASTEYTEVEFCVIADSDVVDDTDVIQFRITDNGSALDTYSVTPQWTIGTSGSEYSQDCDETVTIVDSLVRTPTKTLSEVVTIVASMIKTPSRFLAETITLVDSMIKTGGKILSEVVTIVDTITAKITARALSETITIVDSITKTASRSLSEVITIVDSVLKTGGKSLNEAVTIVDTFVRTAGKTLSEVVTIVDSVIRDFARSLSESITIVDSVTRTISRAFDEVVVLVDSVITSAVKFVDASETITIVDSITRTTTKVLNEVVTLVDSMIRSITRAFNETITLVDTISNQAGKILSEAITLVDDFSSNVFRGFSLTEVITIVDTFTRSVSRSFNEAISIVDSVAKTIGRSFSEAVTLVDTFTRSIGKVYSESIVVVDTFSRSISRTFSEVVTIVDSVAKTSGKALSEAIAISDIIARSASKALNEAISLVDGISLGRTLSVAFDEVIELIDSVTRAIGSTYHKGKVILTSIAGKTALMTKRVINSFLDTTKRDSIVVNSKQGRSQLNSKNKKTIL